MSLNKLIILFLLIAAGRTFPMNCELVKAMNHPKLSQNPEFWDRFYKINSKDEAAVKKLISEYAPESVIIGQTITNSSVAASKLTIEISHKAEKEIGKLSKINQSHYDDFLKTVNEKGLQGLRERPGKWNYEPVREYGANAHSVRLDGGMRVLFDVDKSGAIVVRAVNKTIGH